MPPQILRVVFPKIHPIQQDPAFGGIIKPGQQLDQRSLAGAILPYQRQLFANPERKGQMAVSPAFRVEITEADIFKTKALLYRIRKRQGMRHRSHPGRELKKFEKVLQIDSALRDTGKPRQDPLQEAPQLTERPSQKDQVTNRQTSMNGPKDDHHISKVISHAAK